MLSDERLILLMDRPAQACRKKTEVWSRVCGFFRPVSQWNKGKKEEFADRTPYEIQASGKKKAADSGGGVETAAIKRDYPF